MELISNSKVKELIDGYPNRVQKNLLHIRQLILKAAAQVDGLETLEETLKWGEPSYLTKYGSTLRMDWKQKTPEQFAVYFKCTSKLVPTFRILYKDTFKFEGNRAIVFQLNEEISETALIHCISLALNYHKLKHLHLLGA